MNGRHSTHDTDTFYFPTYLLRHNEGAAGPIPSKDERCGGEAAASPIGSGVPLQRARRRMQPSSAVPRESKKTL